MAAVSGPNVSVGGTCRLYLITPPEIDVRSFRGQLTEALSGGDVACLQLRLKDVSDDAILAAADALLPILKDRDVPLLVNDRPDLAKAAEADGVHVGQQDASYEEARALLGDDAIIGVTCHNSRHLAMVAGEKGADYVAFGAFYPTATKDAPTRADLDLLRWWNEIMTVPSVAIGGITVENAGPVIAAGADFIAVSAGVWRHPDGPAKAVTAFNRVIAETRVENPVI